MEYISAAEAAENWGVSLRQVQRLLAAKRIPNTKKYGRSWMIPEGAAKPADLRQERRTPQYSLSSDLGFVIDATISPMPSHNPDAILDTVREERLRLQFEAELAYLRGDFERTIHCFRKTGGDDAAKLRACPVTIAAAISLGDYSLYTEIETFLKKVIHADMGKTVTALAELSLNTAYVSAYAPNMVSDWLKDGDFTALPPKAKPDAAYKRAKYFHSLGNLESMLAVGQTALSFCDLGQGFTYHSIYFRIVCAMACYGLDRTDEARRYLLDAMNIALPHGFITPFAESATGFGGLLEQCLEREFPKYYDAMIGQWKRTYTNWLTFHNRFTKDNITLILSLRDYEMASLVARRIPYEKIAKQFNISVGRLNNIMRDIYAELFVSNREELSKLIL